MASLRRQLTWLLLLLRHSLFVSGQPKIQKVGGRGGSQCGTEAKLVQLLRGRDAKVLGTAAAGKLLCIWDATPNHINDLCPGSELVEVIRVHSHPTPKRQACSDQPQVGKPVW